MNRLKAAKGIVVAASLLALPSLFTSAESKPAKPPRMLEVKEWSNSKTKDKRRMFLVEPGERMIFSVNVPDAKAYEWRVNKRLDERQRDRELTFVVPRAKGIWEIHVTAAAARAKADAEWVISTLSEQEAPELFEYFADGLYAGERGTDPWERPMRPWSVAQGCLAPSVSRCYMEPPEGGNGDFGLRTESKIACGTWRFQFRFPAGYFVPPGGGGGPRTQLYYFFIVDSDGQQYRYNKASDLHNYLGLLYEPGG